MDLMSRANHPAAAATISQQSARPGPAPRPGAPHQAPLPGGGRGEGAAGGGEAGRRELLPGQANVPVLPDNGVFDQPGPAVPALLQHSETD